MASAIAHGQGHDQACLVRRSACRRRVTLTLSAAEQTRERLRSVPDELGLPLIVKPPHEGSSIGVTKVDGYSDMQAAVTLAAALTTHEVLCEEFIDGEEVTCPVIGEGAAARLPVVRIVAPEGAYDYQNKYFTDDVQYLVPERPAAGRGAGDPAARAGRLSSARLPWLGPRRPDDRARATASPSCSR